MDRTQSAIGEWTNLKIYTPEAEGDLGLLYSQNGQIDWPRTNAVLEEIGILPRDSCGWCPWRTECEAGHFAWCSNNQASWDSALKVGGAVWCDAGNGLGHWVHWSDYGSDENGDGTPWHHVATEACAQSIADLGQVAI